MGAREGSQLWEPSAHSSAPAPRVTPDAGTSLA